MKFLENLFYYETLHFKINVIRHDHITILYQHRKRFNAALRIHSKHGNLTSNILLLMTILHLIHYYQSFNFLLLYKISVTLTYVLFHVHRVLNNHHDLIILLCRAQEPASDPSRNNYLPLCQCSCRFVRMVWSAHATATARN